MVLGFPRRKYSHFPRAYTTPKASSWMSAYLNSVDVAEREPQVTIPTVPSSCFCVRRYPRPSPLASVMRVEGKSGL